MYWYVTSIVSLFVHSCSDNSDNSLRIARMAGNICWGVALLFMQTYSRKAPDQVLRKLFRTHSTAQDVHSVTKTGEFGNVRYCVLCRSV